MHWSVHEEQLEGRIILGAFITVALIGLVLFITHIKRNHKQKNWFIPIGLKTPLYQSRYHLWKSDYPIWMVLSILALIYWFGGYLVVNLIQLAQFNQAMSLAQSHGGIVYEWDPNKIILNGDHGAFNAKFADGSELPNGATTLMPFVMKQTNVTFYLFNVMNNTICGTNMENFNTPFLALPNPLDPFLLNTIKGIKVLNFKDKAAPDFVNTVLNGLDSQNFQYINSQMTLWVHSFVYSNILFTPLCQFLSFAFPLSIALSYKKDVASLFAPWAFLGGSITIYGGIVADENIHATWQLIFFDQQLFFGYHAFLMIGGLSWMFYCNRCNLLRFFYTYVLIASYVAYVWIVTRVFNVHYFTTGLTRLDYSIGGSYIIVSLILEYTNIVFPGNAAIMIFVFTSIINIVIIIKNWIHTKFWKKRIENYDETFVNDVKFVFNFVSRKIQKWVKHGK
ncbi:DUF5378 family protein [Mycoplasmoides pirum]|uniref:DUF5378 family protein n=1 Tax=Mycoplasmoides pirum TaxID=2122 RepID=UPI000482791B|nr:DUF5378 family protein [Mycoplasmoides pirum]